MPKDDCFVPCSADALLNKDVVQPKADRNAPIRVDVKRILRKPIEVSAPV